MFKLDMYKLDKYISTLPDFLYWGIVAFVFFFMLLTALSVLGMLLPLVIFGLAFWFFMALMRDPRFDVIIIKLRDLFKSNR